MEATKFLKLVVVMLLLINSATLSFLWLGRKDDHGHHGPPGRPGATGFFLEEQLELTNDQQQLYKEMREQHHSQMLQLRRKAAGYRNDINTQLKAAVPDSQLVVRYSDSIGYCQRAAEIITLYHFRDLRQICTSKQQAKFDRVIHEAIQMLVNEK